MRRARHSRCNIYSAINSHTHLSFVNGWTGLCAHTYTHTQTRCPCICCVWRLRNKNSTWYIRTQTPAITSRRVLRFHRMHRTALTFRPHLHTNTFGSTKIQPYKNNNNKTERHLISWWQWKRLSQPASPNLFHSHTGQCNVPYCVEPYDACHAAFSARIRLHRLFLCKTPVVPIASCVDAH